MAILVLKLCRQRLVAATAPTAEGIDEAGQPLLLEDQPPKSDIEDGEQENRISGDKAYTTTWTYEYWTSWWGMVWSVAFVWFALWLCSVLFGKPSVLSSPSSGAALQRCPDPAAIPTHAPRKNIWKNINMAEAMSVRDWLSAPERGLNITPSDRAYDSDNIIHYVEAFKPNKAAALEYLSNSSIGVDKYAHAIVNSGTNETIVDYLVGPLPISDKTTFRPLNEIYRDPIPLNARATFNWTVLGEYARSHIGPMDEILVDLFGGSILNGTVLPAGVAPMSYDGEWRRTWLQLRRTLPGSWIRPLDFFIYLDMTGTDPSLYKILRIVHDGKAYESIPDVFAAWRRGEMKRTIDDQSNWASRAIQGKARDLDDRAGPRQVMFDGARHRVDRKEDWVSWMDWSFYFSFERDMGLHLWDINFGGERIIYELSPQEAMAQYSGSDPHQSATVWLDRAFGMGGNVREVIVGYDCPEHATLFDAMVHESGTRVRKRAICVFERDRGTPLSRHTGTSKDEMGAIKGYELVVRSISTVGNYDYLFDYVFQLDGTIEIRVSASGYLQGGLWDPSQDPYGHQLQMQSMGSLHDHVINFKVDFDIAGTRNSMMAVTLEKEETPSRWDDDWGSTKVQQRINRKVIERESLLEYAPNMQGTYVVYNPSSRNAYNNPRGYSIHPGPTCHLTNLDAKRTEKNVNWAKHHLAVSRRKEEEPSSSSGWNINLPGAPPVDFYDFFDDESIEEEDLVVWLNLGTHHVPRAEDSPNTLTNLATSYVLLVPYNFHDHDPSIDSRNSVLLNKKHGRYEIHEAVKPKQCIPPYLGALSHGGLEMWDEHGNVVNPDEGSYDTSSHGMRLWH